MKAIAETKSRISLVRKAVARASGSEIIGVYDRLGRLYFMQKNYDLALQRLEKAIGLASNNAELRDYLLNRKEFVLRGAKEAGQTGPPATQP